MQKGQAEPCERRGATGLFKMGRAVWYPHPFSFSLAPLDIFFSLSVSLFSEYYYYFTLLVTPYRTIHNVIFPFFPIIVSTSRGLGESCSFIPYSLLRFLFHTIVSMHCSKQQEAREKVLL